MTIITTSEFKAGIPEGFKDANGPGGTMTRSPLENTFAFADPNRPHPVNQDRDSAYINKDKNYAAYMDGRMRNVPDYSDLYAENRNFRQVEGKITGKTYVLRRDPVFTYWHIDNYPGAFTRLDFAYNKIADIERIIEQKKLEHINQVA